MVANQVAGLWKVYWGSRAQCRHVDQPSYASGIDEREGSGVVWLLTALGFAPWRLRGGTGGGII